MIAVRTSKPRCLTRRTSGIANSRSVVLCRADLPCERQAGSHIHGGIDLVTEERSSGTGADSGAVTPRCIRVGNLVVGVVLVPVGATAVRVSRNVTRVNGNVLPHVRVFPAERGEHVL